MVRISKQAERRAKCPHRHRPPGIKTGPKKEIPFKAHSNVVEDETLAQKIFIPKNIG